MVPNPERIREVNHNVATAVVLAAQTAGLASTNLGGDKAAVSAALTAAMWNPCPKKATPLPAAPPGRKLVRKKSDFGSEGQHSSIPVAEP